MYDASNIANAYLPKVLRRPTLGAMKLAARLKEREENKYSYFCSKEKGFVYIVNPLVASQSTLFFLESCASEQGFDLLKSFRIEGQGFPESITQLKIFSFVRNPWARVVSCYHKKIVNADSFAKLLLLSKYPSIDLSFTFEEFVLYLASEEGSDGNSDGHWLSQSKILYDGEELVCDSVVKMEDFPAAQSSLYADLGLYTRQTRPIGTSDDMRIKREAKHFVSFYNQRTWNLVGTRYANDVANFGYDTMTYEQTLAQSVSN